MAPEERDLRSSQPGASAEDDATGGSAEAAVEGGGAAVVAAGRSKVVTPVDSLKKTTFPVEREERCDQPGGSDEALVDEAAEAGAAAGLMGFSPEKAPSASGRVAVDLPVAS